MDDEIIGFGAPLQAYVEIAYDYYMQDRLDAAMQVVTDAFAEKGWPAGDWTEFYNELQCEKDARDASVIITIDDRLSIEIARSEPDNVREMLAKAALDARMKVGELLSVEFNRPVLISVFLPDAPLDFISGSYGYVARKYDLDKICIPHNTLTSAKEAYSTLLHEFSHVAASVLAGDELPHWLDEGLAMHLGEETSTRQSRFIIRTAVSKGVLLDVDELEHALSSRDLRKDEPMTVDAAYVMAGNLVGYWVESKGLQSVRETLARMGKGQPVEHAIRGAAGVSLRDLLTGWRKSIGAANV